MKPGNCQVCGHEKRLLFTNYACFNERCGKPDLAEIQRLYDEACTPRVWVPNAAAVNQVIAQAAVPTYGNDPCGLCGDPWCAIWVSPDDPQAKAYVKAIGGTP